MATAAQWGLTVGMTVKVVTTKGLDKVTRAAVIESLSHDCGGTNLCSIYVRWFKKNGQVGKTGAWVYDVSRNPEQVLVPAKTTDFNGPAYVPLGTKRVIGRKYGDNKEHGTMTILDPKLEGTFGLDTFPGGTFRVHPQCDGLICHDGEVVLQVDWRKGDGWQDFIREQQAKVLPLVTEVPATKPVVNPSTFEATAAKPAQVRKVGRCGSSPSVDQAKGDMEHLENTIESLLDKHDIKNVLAAFATVCFAKSNRLRERAERTGGSDTSARQWEEWAGKLREVY